jgi:hypothetical protein
MRAASLLVALALAAAAYRAVAQGRVFASDKLPPASIELKPSEPPLPPKPWRLPQAGDPLYDAKKEAETKDAAHTQTVHVFERGIFKGYASLTSGPPRDPPGKKMDSVFTPNSKLPPDAVELSRSEHPDKSDYFQTRPKIRPANVPEDFVAVQVFHRGKFIGWSWLPKASVAALHKPQ